MKSLNGILLLILILGTALLTGCSTTSPVMAASGGQYTVTKTGTTGFTPVGMLRKSAYTKANEFAKDKGMIAEVISVNETPAGFGQWPQVDLRFRLMKSVARNESDAQPSFVVQGQAGYDVRGRATNTETKVFDEKEVDVYEELKKLGELKEKGILSLEEFQKEKARVLSRSK